MSLSADQILAFKTGGGFTPEQIGHVLLAFVFAILLLWGVWAIRSAYAGWVNHQLSAREFFLVVIRFAGMYCVLAFFLLS